MRRPVSSSGPSNDGRSPTDTAGYAASGGQFRPGPGTSHRFDGSNPGAQLQTMGRDPTGYAGRAWLGTGIPHPLPIAPASVPSPPAFGPLQYAASRPSYDLAGIAALLSPWWHVPIRVDYGLLVKIRETIPMISAAIMRMKELVGRPEVQASPSLKTDIDAFLTNLPVNRMQVGMGNWLQSHLDNMYTFGRSHAEAILNNTRTDLFGLVEVDPRTVGLRPTFGGYATHVVQYQYGGGIPVTLLPELLLSSVNDIRGDDPNGTSLIAELPFVAQILNAMLRSLGSTWDRFGSPTYHVRWNPPADWADPSGDQGKVIMGQMQGNLQNALKNRAEGVANDFFTVGDVEITILGAQGEQLEFAETGRAIMEQIVAKFGLPPFMYGFSWASTERMSTAQAKLLTEIIEASREVVGPQIERLIRLWQLVTGRGGKFTLAWPKTSLIDLLDVARSRAMDAQAESAELSNWSIKVGAGINSMEEMARQFRDDLEDLDAEQIRKRLPKLATEPPVIMPPPGRGGDVGEGAGGNNPRDEATRALVTNGNGRH